jgi:hypothetical protein
MITPYTKHDDLLKRDLTASERLEPARTALRYAVELLRQFDRDTSNAWDKLTEEQLLKICEAAEVALNAAENAAFMGREFYPKPVWEVKWDESKTR